MLHELANMVDITVNETAQAYISDFFLQNVVLSDLEKVQKLSEYKKIQVPLIMKWEKYWASTKLTYKKIMAKHS